MRVVFLSSKGPQMTCNKSEMDPPHLNESLSRRVEWLERSMLDLAASRNSSGGSGNSGINAGYTHNPMPNPWNDRMIDRWEEMGFHLQWLTVMIVLCCILLAFVILVLLRNRRMFFGTMQRCQRRCSPRRRPLPNIYTRANLSMSRAQPSSRHASKSSPETYEGPVTRPPVETNFCYSDGYMPPPGSTVERVDLQNHVLS